jgi:hypothetical protein
MKIILFVTLLYFSIQMCYAQVVYHPLESRVYAFLENQSLKKMIMFHNEVLPMPRIKIAEHLVELEKNSAQMNSLEREELEWYKREFADEIKRLSNSTINERWFLLSYSDSLFSLRVSPIAGYFISKIGENGGHQRWWGANVYGSYGKWFGAFLNMRDKGEFGDNVDRFKYFSPATGHTRAGAPGGVEHSDVRGGMNFDWNWGGISLAKDYFTWGHGKFGQLIHSVKAPSYPFIRFDLNPVEWFRFYYIFGSLTSNVLDSSQFYRTNPNSLMPITIETFVNKYIAANLFSFTPWDWLDLSVGNSLVISGDLRMELFIPFMFFKYLDRDIGQGSVDDGNGQLHFDIAVKYPETFLFYSTFFLDVTEIRNVLKKDFHNTWAGLTVGGKKVDLFIDNLDLTLEYTAITPWVYEHRDQATTYKHIDYQLGHWIGQNADHLRLQFDYRIIRGLQSSIFFERVRKGGLKDIYYAYKDKATEQFLYSPLRKDMRFGIEAQYEIIHDLFIKTHYHYSDISDEDKLRTPDWQLGKKHQFGLAVYYGL